MLDPSSEHPPNPDSLGAKALMPCATAGQRAATTALSDAVAQRRPIIVLFGDAGVGKTTLIRSFLAATDPHDFAVVQLSATSGEFVGPPSFDALLDVICRQLDARQPAGQRPATLAVLAAAVQALAHAGRTVLLAIDHADHLTNNVIAETTRLAEYLDASPESFVCILIGSPTVASRLDAALRSSGTTQQAVEIRVSPPSAGELAALLAYEDSVPPDGPVLTPGAIDRISAYAKTNLHWAAPLADAARTLAASQGEREVTPELVRGALFELWLPQQSQPGDSTMRLTSNPAVRASNSDSITATTPGMADVGLGSFYGADTSVPPTSPSAAASASSVSLPPSSPAESTTRGAGVSRTVSTRHPRAVGIALAAAVLMVLVGIVAFALKDGPDHIGQRSQSSQQTEFQSPTSQPSGPQGEGDAKRFEQQNQTGQMAPAEPMPSDATPSETSDVDHGQAAGSANEQTSDTVSASPNITPTAPPVPGAPAPAPKATIMKKAPAPKVSKRDLRQVPSQPWIQTR
jgi:type II secretory pathway predicted ATPase ExeA